MARFSLRNQNKISKKFGSDFLFKLISELKKEFNVCSEFIIHTTNENYKFIIVGDYEFIIISQTYDVYNLAYKPKSL